jgi:hypothetical protein
VDCQGCGIRVRVLGAKRLWRLELVWCRNYLGLYWLSNLGIISPGGSMYWRLASPLVEIGERWKEQGREIDVG